jgi:hypothetical protein
MMTEIVKVCKKHGDLTIDEVHKDKSSHRCAYCGRSSALRSQKKHFEKRRAKQDEWKKNNKQKYKEALMRAKHKYTDDLANSYIRQNLIRCGWHKSQITPEMIEIKRVILSLHRIKKDANI